MARFALFDFDGTLTRTDTTRYLVLELLKLRPWLVIHSPALVWARLFGSAEALQYAKNRCIGHLLSGLAPDQVDRVAGRFGNRVAPLLRASVLEQARADQAAGIQVIVVTASPEFAVAPIFAHEGFWCVGTRYQMASEVYGGQLEGRPCYGEGKIPALRTRGVAEDDRIVSAWSDSLSDLPMMLLADVRHWVCAPESATLVRAADPDGRIFLD